MANNGSIHIKLEKGCYYHITQHLEVLANFLSKKKKHEMYK
jgi:hypothetical protein